VNKLKAITDHKSSNWTKQLHQSQ